MKLNKILLLITVLYFTWQFGRWYQSYNYNAPVSVNVAPQPLYMTEVIHTYTEVKVPIETIVERVEYVPAETPSMEFEITAYCTEDYPHICNNGDASQTSTGAVPTVGRTIAVDNKIIPYGTKVYIDGMGVFTAEDTFGTRDKGYCIDILMKSHKEALQFGRQSLKIWILGE